MNCMTCGARVPDEAATCANCGAAAPRTGSGGAGPESTAGGAHGPPPAGASGTSPGEPYGPPPGDRSGQGHAGSSGDPGGGDRPGAWHNPGPGPAREPVHPSGLDSETRNWAVAAHLSAFLGAFVAIAALGPLVVWLIRREVDGFSERHAREALNFNLTLLVLLAVSFVVAVFTLGIALIVLIPVGLVVAIVWIVTTIIAAVRASEGRDYRYPMTIRFLS